MNRPELQLRDISPWSSVQRLHPSRPRGTPVRTERPPDFERRLAVILAADVVEYGRLMGADEDATVRTLRARRATFDALVSAHGGREFGSVGDSLMAQFASAVNAVRCAQAIQCQIEADNSRLPLERQMHLRIGVTVGDVIEENGTAFGDAVNVAARLQALAKPGGVLVSGLVYELVRERLHASFVERRSRGLKNIPRAVRTCELVGPDSGQATPERSGLLGRVLTQCLRRAAALLAELAMPDEDDESAYV